MAAAIPLAVLGTFMYAGNQKAASSKAAQQAAVDERAGERQEQERRKFQTDEKNRLQTDKLNKKRVVSATKQGPKTGRAGTILGAPAPGVDGGGIQGGGGKTLLGT